MFTPGECPARALGRLSLAREREGESLCSAAQVPSSDTTHRWTRSNQDLYRDAPRWPRRLSSPSMLMPFQTVGAHRVHQGKTELSNLFSLFSPLPPVECLSWLECKNLLPIILHADDSPTVLLRLVVKCLRERADFGGRQPFSRTVRILARGIVVQNDHRQ